MKSSSESMLPAVVAGVARSETLFLSETGKSSPAPAVEPNPLSLSSALLVLRSLLDERCPAVCRDDSTAGVAALTSLSSIAASSAFLFLV